MRPALHGIDIITNEANGQFIGFDLGYDFCAEHETGVRPMRRFFGMGEYAFETGLLKKKPRLHIDLPKDFVRADAGIAKRMPTCELSGIVDRTLLVEMEHTGTEPDETRLLFHSGHNPRTFDYLKEALETRESSSGVIPLKPYSSDPKRKVLATSWNDRGFIIRAFGERERAGLRELYEALLKGDVAIGLSAAKLFGNGLTVLIASRIPEAIARVILDKDLDHIRMLEAAKKTGIEDKVKAAGLQYFALSPRWLDSERYAGKSKYSVGFWLNPMQQDRYHSRLCTVEELEQWTRGEGPVIKVAKGAAA